MKKSIFSFCILIFVATTAVCQDYITEFDISNGYTLVYKKIPPTAQYTVAQPKMFGIINSENKLVVPMLYKSILNSGENGIFIIKDQKDDEGIYSVAAQKAVVEPQFFDIESFSEGLAVVKKRKEDNGFLWGSVDVNGNIIIPVEYDYLGALSEGLINFKKDNKFGFLDKTNKIIIPATYDDFSSFNDGLAAVKTGPDGKYGYIDKNNNLVIPAQYEDANYFSGGYAVVAKKKGYTTNKVGQKAVTVPGLWIVIDKTGKQIQERSFDKVSQLNAGGLFIIESDGKKGTMNTAGMPILPMEYSDVLIDKAGYTVFKTIDKKKYGMMNNKGTVVVAPDYDYVSPTTANRFYVIQNGKYTVGDVNNNVFVQPDSANGVLLGKKHIVYYYTDKVKIFDLNGNAQKTFTGLNLKSYGHSLSQTEDSIKLSLDNTVYLNNLTNNSKKAMPFGEAGDFNEEGIFVGKRKLYDFYDYTGKKLNTQSYFSVVNFSEGVCALQETNTSAPHLADKNFNKIKDLYTYFIGPYSEGVAYATDKENTTAFYLDKKGQEAFKLTAAAGGKCIGGIIIIKDKSNKYYLVNKTGKQISTKTWDEIGEFSEGLAMVKENYRWGFIDLQGNKVIEPKFDVVSNFTKGAAMVKQGDKFFLINKSGQPVNSTKYDAAGVPSNGSFPVLVNGLAGLIDAKGNTLIGFKYATILCLVEDRVWASNKEGKWALLDNKGNALTDFIFEGSYEFKDGFAKVLLNDKVGVVNKSGKLVVPAEYQSLGSFYKNTVLGVKPAETVFYNLK